MSFTGVSYYMFNYIDITWFNIDLNQEGFHMKYLASDT